MATRTRKRGASSLSYYDKLLRYVEEVEENPKRHCLYERQAVARFRKDLQRTEGKRPRFYFDEDTLNHVCTFAEIIPHVKGKWSSDTIVLEGWQIFILGNVLAWKETTTDLRRFRDVYLEVPRKNAKTTLLAIVTLYVLAYDDDQGIEVYSAATTRDQAKICWKIAYDVVKRTEKLREIVGLDISANAVFCERNGGSYKAISAEASNLDGLNTNLAAIDELHAHKTREVYDVLETSTGSRKQPLMFAITTAGSDKTGICYERRNYAIQVLKSAVSDDTTFCMIFTVDDGDDWTQPSSWFKANPNLGVSCSVEDLERKVKKALVSVSSQFSFMTKHLNVWMNSASSWLKEGLWDACYDSELTREQFHGHKVIAALDIATRSDVCCKLLMFEHKEGYAVFCDSFLPQAAVEESDNAAYAGWAEEGWLTVCPGNVLDLKMLSDSLHKDKELYEIVEVPYDPFQATQFATELLEEGFPMVIYGATVRNFSEPMKELEAKIIEKKIYHDGNPVLSWMMNNVVCRVDAKDNVYPRKEFDENKIDGAVAMIMAIARYMFIEYTEDPYESRGLRFIGGAG